MSNYDECQISIHAMYGWRTDRCQSDAALSDYTGHKAAAVMTSILPVLKNYVEEGKTTINIVNDSPTSQYRNRKIFYLIHQFAEEYNVTLNWIYLEAGHGKGIPNGTGTVVKQAIQNVITFNTESFTTLSSTSSTVSYRCNFLLSSYMNSQRMML